MRAVDIDDLEAKFDAYLDNLAKLMPLSAALLRQIKEHFFELAGGLETVATWVSESEETREWNPVFAYFPERDITALTFRKVDGSFWMEADYGKPSYVYRLPSSPKGGSK
jgi:hypothetical protein